METHQKIKGFAVSQLNNTEYANHMTRFQGLIPVEDDDDDRPVIESNDLTGPLALGFSAELIAEFGETLALLTDLVNVSTISDETSQLREVDAYRDECIVFFTSDISQKRKSPIAAQKNAAVSLYNVIKPYVGIGRLADQQETQQILGLLVDMEKEPNKTNVATLGLTAVLEELKAANDEFARLTEQRTANKAANAIDNSKVVRQRMEPIYEEMLLLAQSYNIVQPTAETTAFVTAVNALIDETKARYNQRIGIAKANKNKKEPDDRPVIE
ncbi:DUF6261 family protein [Parabacteroides sp.]